jgi:DNA-binding CsgD family transcriptional regulator
MSAAALIVGFGGAVAPTVAPPEVPSYATHLANGMVIIVDRRGLPIAATRAALTMLTGTAHPSLVRAKEALAVAARALVRHEGVDGDLRFAAELKIGDHSFRAQTLPFDMPLGTDLVAIVLSEPAPSTSPALANLAVYGISAREREIVSLLVEGLTSKEIGGRLGLSPNTVKAHLRLIMVKMEVSTRSGIVGKLVNRS